MRRSKDRRFEEKEGFEQCAFWVDHKVSQVKIPAISIVGILEELSITDLPGKKFPTFEILRTRVTGTAARKKK